MQIARPASGFKIFGAGSESGTDCEPLFGGMKKGLHNRKVFFGEGPPIGGGPLIFQSGIFPNETGCFAPFHGKVSLLPNAVELKLLRDAYAAHRRPSDASLVDLLPRHPIAAIRDRACALGLSNAIGRVPVERIHHWLRVAHEYFGRRERGLLKIVSLGVSFGIAAALLIGRVKT